MEKYKTTFKIKVVKSFLAREGGARLLAWQWSVPEEKIRTRVSHYRLHGLDGLCPKRSAYSEQFKLQVLSHQDREQLSNRQVAAVYDIRNPNQVVVWRRNLDEGGVEAIGRRQTRQQISRVTTSQCFFHETRYIQTMIKTLPFIITFAVLSATLSASATPGKVNKAGCHASKKEGAHCHPERAEGSGGSDGTQSARDKRLKRECKGGVNAGACKGYTS